MAKVHVLTGDLMAHLRILMATYQGATFLPDQLGSFASQTHDEWSLLVSDDGSTDGTRELVADFARSHPAREVILIDGPRAGSAANFMHALAQPRPAGSFVALSDQDDIWQSDRVARALSLLAAREGDADCQILPAVDSDAAIYASRTILMGDEGRPLGASVLHPRGPSFGNALVQNILAGNTMVLNPAAADLAARTAPLAIKAGVGHHDWWLYALTSGTGAQVIHDNRPGLFYRQHRGNVLGAHRSLAAARNRWQMLRAGQYRRWLTANLAALSEIRDALTPQAQDQLAQLSAALKSDQIPLAQLHKSGIRRQSWRGDAVLAVSLRLQGK